MFSKTVRCYEIDQRALTNVSCRLKVTRQIPTGLIQIKVDIIYMDDFFIRLTLFYRYTGGFRPYLLDYTVNACDLVKYTNYFMDNPVINRMVTGIKEVFPRLFAGCPYKVSFYE